MSAANRHDELRKLMRQKGKIQRDVAAAAEMTYGYFVQKLQGARPFSLKEAYLIAAYLWVEPDQVERLFPEIKELEW